MRGGWLAVAVIGSLYVAALLLVPALSRRRLGRQHRWRWPAGAAQLLLARVLAVTMTGSAAR